MVLLCYCQNPGARFIAYYQYYFNIGMIAEFIHYTGRIGAAARSKNCNFFHRAKIGKFIDYIIRLYAVCFTFISMSIRFLYTALSFLLLTSINSYGQSPGNFSIENGLENYPLGSKEPKKDSLLIIPDGGIHYYNGVNYTTYLYKPASAYPYKLAGVDFKILILTYGDGTIGNIEFTKVCGSQFHPDCESKAKDEFKKLYAFFKEQLKKKGKKKKYRHGAVDVFSNYLQYEWQHGANVMILKLDWFEHPKGSTYSISLSLEAKTDL